MTDDDDNLLHAYDLSAWGAPPAPANLADGVIARVTATDEAIAAMKQRGSKRRWWLIGGVAAAVAAVTIGVWVGVRATTTEEPVAGTGSGSLIADRAQRIDLGTSSANVDAGARVQWTRDGAALHATQDAGTATWNIGPKDTLVLASTGATIEAAGGSLRVEVHMNATDFRVIGASAATAAAVALVTVIVYEGHVKVTSAQQTMVVVPGTTVEVASGKPPVQPLPSDPPPGVDLVLPAGESATVHDPRGEITVLIRGACDGSHTRDEMHQLAAGEYRYTLACDGKPILHPEINVVRDPGTAAEQVAAILAPIDGTAWTTPVHVAGAAMTGATVSVSGRGILVDGANHGFAGDVDLGTASTLAVRVEHPQQGIHYFLRRKGTAPVDNQDKTVAQQTLEQELRDLDDRIAKAVRVLPDAQTDADREAAKAKLAALQKELFELKQRAAAKAPPPACDQDALMKLAEESTAKGQHAKALEQYETAARCKSDQHVLQLAFMEACNANNVAKARVHWKALTPEIQNRTIMICVRNKITREMLEGGATPAPSCDQDELLKAAEHSVELGNHGEALKRYEAANACKSDAHTLQLAFMESCNSENLAKARVYWKKLSTQLQNRVEMICVRNNITRAMLDGEGASQGDVTTPPPTHCDEKHLLAVAETSVALGNHGQALRQYEDALRCKTDVHTLTLTFMEACNSVNISKAKTYWKKLSVDAQNRALMICVRNKITRDQLEGP